MQASDSPVIRIGAWRVDPTLDEISKDGNTVKLERRAMQLLLCLARHADQVVSVEQLLDEVWTGVVVTPDSVYHAVAALRRLLGDDTKRPTYIANVPRRGYRLIAPVAPWIDSTRLPLAAPPLPAVETAGSALAVARTSSPGLAFTVALSIALSLALGYLLVDRVWLSKHATIAEHQPTNRSTVLADRSIAVLPFVDMSEKRDQQYFADGMAEEVLDLLANIPGLKVIGRTSSFQFKGTNADLRAIGSALGVSYVVQGSVRRSGERFRVTTQLINAQDGSNVWSYTYDEPVGDTLKVQDEIASNLARALQVTVESDFFPEHSFKSAEGYDLFLRGLHAEERADKEGLGTAAAYFQQVLDLDPSSVAAQVELAGVQEYSAEFGYAEPHTGFEVARQSAQRVLALDPKSGWAYLLLSSIDEVYDWDWAAAERDAKEGLRLKPQDSGTIGNLGRVYEALGRWDDAERLLRTALTLDPLSAGLYVQLGNVQIATGRLADGEAAYRKTLQISPTFAEGHLDLAEALLLQGNFQGALAEAQQERSDSARNVSLAQTYHALGRRAESDAALAQVIHGHGQDEAWEIADVYAYRGEPQQAFLWLDRAYSQRDAGLYLIKADPFFVNLKNDPRYKAFLRKMNLPE
jgi:TolB-like protein/DNA-binding winged helix-turn-helix (wHTH) protein/Tfp pilus assembly protein PilF